MFKKIFFILQKKIIKIISYFNTELYMKLSTKYFKSIGIEIEGMPKFISSDVYLDGKDYTKIKVGNNVVISREVMLLTHDYSITAGLASVGEIIKRNEGEKYFLGGIEIGENSFIGARTSILPNTKIGKNVIIGACSVVKGNIPDNSIAVGNPCRVICKTDEWTEKSLKKTNILIES